MGDTGDARADHIGDTEGPKEPVAIGERRVEDSRSGLVALRWPGRLAGQWFAVGWWVVGMGVRLWIAWDGILDRLVSGSLLARFGASEPKDGMRDCLRHLGGGP